MSSFVVVECLRSIVGRRYHCLTCSTDFNTCRTCQEAIQREERRKKPLFFALSLLSLCDLCFLK